jgi:hypothetical protein
MYRTVLGGGAQRENTREKGFPERIYLIFPERADGRRTDTGKENDGNRIP